MYGNVSVGLEGVTHIAAKLVFCGALPEAMGRPFLRVSLGSVVTVTLVYDCKKSLQTIKKDRFLNTSKSRFDSVYYTTV